MFCILLLCLLVSLLAGAGLVASLLESRRVREREEATRGLSQTLEQARLISADYVRTRTIMRQNLEQSLNRQAATVCNNVQVFLQAALVRREAALTAARLSHEAGARRLLNALARKQAELAAEFAQKVSSAPAKSDTGDEVTIDTTDLTSFFGSDKIKELGQDSELVKEFKAKLEEIGQEMELLMQSRPAAEEDKEWSLALLRDSGPDIESLLPPASTFSAAEAGGRLLLAVGGGKASAHEVRGEAARNMLWQSGEGGLHWVLRVVLAEPEAPPPPQARELAQILGERLGLRGVSGTGGVGGTGGATNITGYVLAQDGQVAAGFPENRHDTTSLPVAGQWRESNDEAQMYVQAEALEPSPWGLGLNVRISAPPLAGQLRQLANENPLYTGLYLAAQAVLLLAIIIQGILAMQAGRQARGDGGIRFIRAAGREAGAPILGSLERLQAGNRGNGAAGGSCILDTARSPVLRELARRIRGNPPEKTRSSGKLREYSTPS